MATGQFTGRVIGRKEVGPQRQFVGLQVEGAEKLRRVLERLGADAPVKMGNAIYRQAEFIMTQSKREVPVDTGNLRDTGHVEPPVISGENVSVTMGYGGTAGAHVVRHTTKTYGRGTLFEEKTRVTIFNEGGEVGYALMVHEDLTARHKVGNAKYLENPVLEAAGKLENRLANDLRKDLLDVR